MKCEQDDANAHSVQPVVHDFGMNLGRRQTHFQLKAGLLISPLIFLMQSMYGSRVNFLALLYRMMQNSFPKINHNEVIGAKAHGLVRIFTSIFNCY